MHLCLILVCIHIINKKCNQFCQLLNQLSGICQEGYVCVEECGAVNAAKEAADLGTDATALIQQLLIDDARCEDDPIEKYCCNKTDVIEASTSTSTTTTTTTTPGKPIYHNSSIGAGDRPQHTQSPL